MAKKAINHAGNSDNSVKASTKKEKETLKQRLDREIRQYYDLGINAYTCMKATGHSQEAVYGRYHKWDDELDQLANQNTLAIRERERFKTIKRIDEILLSIESQRNRIISELDDYNNIARQRFMNGETISKTSNYFLENKKTELDRLVLEVIDLKAKIATAPTTDEIIEAHIAKLMEKKERLAPGVDE